MAEEPSVLLERDSHIAIVTLNRPAALNAINRDVMRGLARACEELARDESVWAVLLQAAGDRAFSAGADLKERQDLDVHETQRLRADLVRTFRMLHSLPMVSLEQTLPGRVLGYGTLQAGPLEIAYVPDPKHVRDLVERLAA